MLKAGKVRGFREECVLSKGISLEPLAGPGDPTIIYIQPCTSIEGRINCEFQFGVPGQGIVEKFFDFAKLSRILNTYADKFTESRVSTNLGVARVQWHGKTILVSRNGRIVIRESISEVDAKATIEFLAKLLAASIICPECGDVVLNCSATICGECGNQQASLSGMSVDASLKQAIEGTRSLATVLDELRDSVGEGSVLGESLESLESLSAQCYRSSQIALDLIVQSEGHDGLAAGVLILRCAWDLSLILGVLDQLRRQAQRSRSSSQPESLHQLLSLWLLILKGVIDGILDGRPREHALYRWILFRKASLAFAEEAKGNSDLQNIVNSLAER
jgi:hypothetical protein